MTTNEAFEAAETYERLFVPAEFREWAPRVVAAAGVRAGQRVLDVACGTGIVAREAVRRVGSNGLVAAVDADPGMLSVAARTAQGIHWCRSDATALPFAAEAFEAVVSQLGLMYFPDRRQAIREMIRVLRTGGSLAVAVWDSLERTPAYAQLVAVLERTVHPRAAEALRAPFVLGDPDTLAALFASAGVPHATVTTHVGSGEFPGVRSMVEAELRGWLPIVGVELSNREVDGVIEQAQRALEPFMTPHGTVRFDAPAHIVTLTKRGNRSSG